LSSVFEMKGLGEFRYVLGIEAVKNCPKKLLDMFQEAYIKKVLERFLDASLQTCRHSS